MFRKLLTAVVCLLVTYSLVSGQRQTRISETAFTVAPGAYVYYQFSIPDRVRNPGIVGRFRASGGGRNDIRVLVMDDDGFENYRNHNQFAFYYDSGYVTVGTINRALVPNHYYLVFDNTGAIVSNKAVRSDIFAQWW